MEREYQIYYQGYENIELKIVYFCRLPFLLIVEKVLTFISDKLDVFRVVRRCDHRRACIAPDNSKMQGAAYQRYGKTRSFED